MDTGDNPEIKNSLAALLCGCVSGLCVSFAAGTKKEYTKQLYAENDEGRPCS